MSNRQRPQFVRRHRFTFARLAAPGSACTWLLAFAAGCADPTEWPPINICALVPCGSGGSPGTATGGGGATNVGGTTNVGGSAGTTPTEMPAATVFADDQVVEYRITIDPADWQQLEEHGDAEEYLPAELSLSGNLVGSQALGTVGLRHKGSWTLHHCWDDFGGVRSYAAECAKLSYKLKFNEYNADTRYEGLKQLNLHAASGDDTKFHELLAYNTFREFGIDTSRIAPARFYINGEFQGLFYAVEEMDGRYTKFHYPAGANGNLYKEVWPRAGLSDDYFIGGLKTNEDAPNVSDIQGFATAIGNATEATFLTDMQPWVDVNQLLRYMAVDRATKNWDGITAFYSPVSPHNFYFYHDDGANGRFHLIPWDLDNTFWEFDPFMAPEQWVTADPVPNWNVLPASCDPVSVWEKEGATRITPPGCDPLLRLLAKTQWDGFVNIGNELLNGPLRYEAMLAKVNRWASVIEPIIAEDPHLDLATWRTRRAWFTGTVLPRAVSDFQAFLKQGYIIQQPDPVLPEPSAEALNAPMAESGILLDRVNNYEFTGGAASDPPAGVYWYGDGAATGSPIWNTLAPESGNADLRFDFTFNRLPGAWDEWVRVAVPTNQYAEVDVSGSTQISMTLRTDSTRTVRVRVDSPAYNDVFGGAWPEFGSEFVVTATPQTFKLKFARCFYPSWAKDDWAGTTKGWTTSDSEALQVLLHRFNGLIFAPQPSTTPAGDLVTSPESGFVQIDNIYFQ